MISGPTLDIVILDPNGNETTHRIDEFYEASSDDVSRGYNSLESDIESYIEDYMPTLIEANVYPAHMTASDVMYTLEYSLPHETGGDYESTLEQVLDGDSRNYDNGVFDFLFITLANIAESGDRFLAWFEQAGSRQNYDPRQSGTQIPLEFTSEGDFKRYVVEQFMEANGIDESLYLYMDEDKIYNDSTTGSSPSGRYFEHIEFADCYYLF